MMSKVTFPFSGVMPSILPSLLPKKVLRSTTPTVKQVASPPHHLLYQIPTDLHLSSISV